MTSQTQSIPQFENDNLLAKIFTSRKWQKKLSNQNMNYQWIPADMSQVQDMLSQVQVNIPNAFVDSCESDYFSFCMKMKIAKEKVNTLYGQIPYATDAPQSYMIVQYKNALYMILYREMAYNGNCKIYSNKMLNKFVEAIESVDIPNNMDPNCNTKDFGFVTLNIYRNTTTSTSSAGIIMTTAHDGIAVNDGNNPEQQIGHVETEDTGSGFQVKNATVTTTQTVPSTMQIQFAYQKLLSLPFNSCSFLDRTVLAHENVDKSQKLQQINRMIYRQQYDPNITQQYMNQHWYIYYGNDKPQVILAKDYDGSSDVVFSYQVMIPMNKIFWMWQADFLPLFKLKNPLNLQFVFNVKMIQGLFEVMTFPQTEPVDSYENKQINRIHASLQTLIDYQEIKYYNIGCYLLVCSDTVMEKKLIEELNDMQGIVLPQTQTWIESYKTNTNEELQYQTSVGFNCLTNVELGLYAAQNQAYFRSYSTLKDICSEYKTYDSTNQIVTMLNEQQQDFKWYQKRLSFYMPQITFNAKQTFIGQKFINSIPLFLSINNRGQDKDDQNPYTENLFDYFNKLNIRYEQFTDKYVKDVESDEMNYSGVSIQKQNNNYITCLLADYNTTDYSSQLVKYTDNIISKVNGTQSQEYFVEMVYKYKQILQIDQQGNLTQMLQEYML